MSLSRSPRNHTYQAFFFPSLHPYCLQPAPESMQMFHFSSCLKWEKLRMLINWSPPHPTENITPNVWETNYTSYLTMLWAREHQHTAHNPPMHNYTGMNNTKMKPFSRNRTLCSLRASLHNELQFNLSFNRITIFSSFLQCTFCSSFHGILKRYNISEDNQRWTQMTARLIQTQISVLCTSCVV